MKAAFEDGLLRHLIADSYTAQSLAEIREVLESHRTHEILPVAHGSFAASPSQQPDPATGYQNVWVRDNVMVANSFRLRGDLAPAIACIQGLTKFFRGNCRASARSSTIPSAFSRKMPIAGRISASRRKP